MHPPAPRPPSPWPAFSLSAYRKHRTSPFRSLRFDTLFSAEERDVGFVVHARRTRVGRVESPSTLLLASLLASLSSLCDHLRRASPPLPLRRFSQGLRCLVLWHSWKISTPLEMHGCSSLLRSPWFNERMRWAHSCSECCARIYWSLLSLVFFLCCS